MNVVCRERHDLVKSEVVFSQATVQRIVQIRDPAWCESIEERIFRHGD